MAIGEYGGSIANPKRSLTINFSIAKIKQAITLCNHYVKDIEKCTPDDVLNIYTLHFSERLSLGSNMIVQLNALDPEKTQLEIEMQRAAGSYDSSVEIDYANRQINYFCEALSKILSMSDEDVEKLRIGEIKIPDSEKKSAKLPWGCALVFFLLLAFLVWILV